MTSPALELDLDVTDRIAGPPAPDPEPPAGVVLAVCEVWRLGSQVGQPTVLGGSIVEDIQANTYRSGTIELAVSDVDELLEPGGTELRVWRWDRFEDGGLWSLLGRFYYRTTSIERTDVGVSLSIHDASQLVRDNRWTEPYAVTPGVPYPEAVARAIRGRLNEFTWAGAQWVGNSARTRAWTWGEDVEHDPWNSARELPRALGWDMLIARDGTLILDPVPELDSGAVVRRFVAGDPEFGVGYLDSGREVVGRGYNVVRARTEAEQSDAGLGEEDDPEPAELFTSLAEDDDPDSPSFVGLYRRPRFLTSSLFNDQRQVDNAAAAELARNVGLWEDVTVEVVSDPRLEPRTVWRVTDPRIRADGLFVVDAVETPVLGGPAQVTLRRRKVES